jgi:hypothetical protein
LLQQVLILIIFEDIENVLMVSAAWNRTLRTSRTNADNIWMQILNDKNYVSKACSLNRYVNQLTAGEEGEASSIKKITELLLENLL